MSGGTPVGATFMRQRHSWGYGSGGEDLEDDACSKPMPPAPSIPRAKSWLETMETLLWIASAMFIVYFGDWHSNLIYVLWHDERIRRIPLYLGFVGVFLSAAYFFYTSRPTWCARKLTESWEMVGASALPWIHLGFVADLELLDSTPCVYTLHGLHGYITLPDYWDIQARTRCAPARLMDALFQIQVELKMWN
ncbi:hypothetical protein Cgig2_023684 [Carnegiea gigantea]|uniref:Uncharacterized protein n=1 Tax=Carnegiea gigantea TaxID=171969 RepID=A0A9Q1KKS9_9CARY|nr:hypothetical protein Cgig2_023684 [Carnegiea gigantea]